MIAHQIPIFPQNFFIQYTAVSAGWCLEGQYCYMCFAQARLTGPTSGSSWDNKIYPITITEMSIEQCDAAETRTIFQVVPMSTKETPRTQIIPYKLLDVTSFPRASMNICLVYYAMSLGHWQSCGSTHILISLPLRNTNIFQDHFFPRWKKS